MKRRSKPTTVIWRGEVTLLDLLAIFLCYSFVFDQGQACRALPDSGAGYLRLLTSNSMLTIKSPIPWSPGMLAGLDL